MALEDLLVSLSGKVDESVVGEVKSFFESETNFSKSKYSKQNQENASLRGRLKNLEENLKALDIDLEGDVAEQLTTKIGGNKDVSTNLEKRLALLQKQFDEKDKREKELTQKLNNQKISAELKKALKTGNITVLDDIEDLIVDSYINSGKVKVLEDGNLRVDRDGVEIEIAEEVEEYKKQYPGRFKVLQNPGSETNSTSKKQNETVKKISQKEFENMSAKDRGSFAKDNPGFVII